MKNKPPHLPESDQNLWDSFTKDVRKIAHDKFIKQLPPKIKLTIREKAPQLPIVNHGLTVSRLSTKEVRGITIDKTIDLHGLTVNEAQKLTEQFILKAYQNNLKWLIIVTGKGKLEKPGILRELLPKWLNELSALVIGYTTANIKDGGSGAFYVKIRRQKKDFK